MPRPRDPAAVAAYNKKYYEEHKNLSGDRGGIGDNTGGRGQPAAARPPAPSKPKGTTQSATLRVKRLKIKVATLQDALSKASAALSEKRQADRKKEKESHDGKSTESEKNASQKYRDKHEQELKSKSQKDSKSSSGGSSTSTSSSKSLSDLSAEELGSRILKIRSALADAKKQLSDATQALGQIAHSEITSEPSFNHGFAQFRSEERITSL